MTATAVNLAMTDTDFDRLCLEAKLWRDDLSSFALDGNFVTSDADEPISQDYAVAYWFEDRASVTLAGCFLRATHEEYQAVRDVIEPGYYVLLTDFLSPMHGQRLQASMRTDDPTV